MKTQTARGFTLIELMVSIAIIALLSSVVFAATNTARKSARDTQRISSLREMQTALELYYNDHGTYPDGENDAAGWDTAINESFVPALVTEHFLPAHVEDPLGVAVGNNLRYAHFPAGTGGCPVARGDFYVLGVADMENSNGSHPLSPGWSCDDRDWGEEMEFVVGKFEN